MIYRDGRGRARESSPRRARPCAARQAARRARARGKRGGRRRAGDAEAIHQLFRGAGHAPLCALTRDGDADGGGEAAQQHLALPLLSSAGLCPHHACWINPTLLPRNSPSSDSSPRQLLLGRQRGGQRAAPSRRQEERRGGGRGRRSGAVSLTEAHDALLRLQRPIIFVRRHSGDRRPLMTVLASRFQTVLCNANGWYQQW